MKLIIFGSAMIIFTAITVYSIFIFTSTEENVVVEEEEQPVLVALGDSIAYGYNLGDGSNSRATDEAFPSLIAEEFDMSLENLSIPGWTTTDMLQRLEEDDEYTETISSAELVALTIGNNDLLAILNESQNMLGGNPIEFIAYLTEAINENAVYNNLQEIIAEIRSLTDAPILIYNVYNPFPSDNFMHEIANYLLPDINTELAQTVNELADQYEDVLLADAYAAFGTEQNLYILAQDIHPSREGQERLAAIGIELYRELN